MHVSMHVQAIDHRGGCRNVMTLRRQMSLHERVHLPTLRPRHVSIQAHPYANVYTHIYGRPMSTSLNASATPASIRSPIHMAISTRKHAHGHLIGEWHPVSAGCCIRDSASMWFRAARCNGTGRVAVSRLLGRKLRFQPGDSRTDSGGLGPVRSRVRPKHGPSKAHSRVPCVRKDLSQHSASGSVVTL